MSYKILKDEKGVSILLLALAFIMILGFSALAIDVAHLYNVKNELQVAADSAALAGVGELTGATDAIKKDNALKAACRLAGKNCADVAYNNIPAAQQGSPIPVTLSTTYGVDVEVGNWDTTLNPVWLKERTPYNAVKVYARRTDANTNQPRAQNWFARVFALLGRNFDFTAIQATALAMRIPAPVLPVAVNEYWLDGSASGRPYSTTIHTYPNSFVRMVQVKTSSQILAGAPNVTSQAYGYTFAFLGAHADSNMSGSPGPPSTNGYIDLDLRSPYHTSSAPSDPTHNCWYAVQDYTGGCTSVSLNFSTSCQNINGGGSVDSGKWGTNFEYFFGDGYPVNRILPDAVYEVERDITTSYWDTNNYSSGNGNDPSNPPYATVPYYSTSGNPLNILSAERTRIPDIYKKGTQFIALVYDGSYLSASGPNPLTIVGYVVMEVDGYSSTIPSGIGLQAGNTQAAHDHNKSVLGSGATGPNNTAYGHAISDIMQPPVPIALGGTGLNGGDCAFTDSVRKLAEHYTIIKLVGTSTNGQITYGTKD